TRTEGSNEIQIYFNTKYRGYIEWDISSIPENATITVVSIRFKSASGYDGDLDFYDMNNQPSISTDETVYTDARDGSLYVSSPA
ncbi:unnamed protein product, partial [marine sediment metagenome]